MTEHSDHQSTGKGPSPRDASDPEQRLHRFNDQLDETAHPRHAWWFVSISRIGAAIITAIMVITWLIFGWSFIALGIALAACTVFFICLSHWAGSRAPSVRQLEEAIDELLEEDKPPSQPQP